MVLYIQFYKRKQNVIVPIMECYECKCNIYLVDVSDNKEQNKKKKPSFEQKTRNAVGSWLMAAAATVELNK